MGSAQKLSFRKGDCQKGESNRKSLSKEEWKEIKGKSSILDISIIGIHIYYKEYAHKNKKLFKKIHASYQCPYFSN